jgi:hypothetical protein
LIETLFYGTYRTWGARRELASVLVEACRRRSLSVRPLALVVQKFMSPTELDTDRGRERLEACTFRVPHAGKMIPMCEMNATQLRSELYPRARIRKAG